VRVVVDHERQPVDPDDLPRRPVVEVGARGERRPEIEIPWSALADGVEEAVECAHELRRRRRTDQKLELVARPVIVIVQVERAGELHPDHGEVGIACQRRAEAVDGTLEIAARLGDEPLQEQGAVPGIGSAERHVGEHPRRLLLAAGADHADEDAQPDPLVQRLESDVAPGGSLSRSRRSGSGRPEEYGGDGDAAQERTGQDAFHCF
jgi:hypothetical protein